MRRGILGVVGATMPRPCGHRARCAIAIRPRLDAFRRRVVGTTITRIDRRGKRVLVWLDTDHAIVFEPRMTGLVLLADPPNQQHLRLRLTLQGVAFPHLWYWDRRGLGRVLLLSRAQVDQLLAAPRLGPDALQVDAPQLRAELGSGRRTIKVALLDQAAVAGIGNLYASEILHVARIDPRVRCQRLSQSQWQRLADSIQCVLEEAIQYEGSTLSDGTYRTALNQTGSYQNHHRVYARAGQLCPSCHTHLILRIVQAQRSTFYCSHCQRRR